MSITLEAAKFAFHHGTCLDGIDRRKGVGEEIYSSNTLGYYAKEAIRTVLQTDQIREQSRALLEDHSNRQQLPLREDLEFLAFGGQSYVYMTPKHDATGAVFKVYRTPTLELYKQSRNPGRVFSIDDTVYDSGVSSEDRLTLLIDLLRREEVWHRGLFSDIDGFEVPKQQYLITADPFADNAPTLATTSRYLEGELIDPFYLDQCDIENIAHAFPQVAITLKNAYDRMLCLASEGIYLDVLGQRNLTIHIDSDQNATIRLIDPSGAMRKDLSPDWVQSRLTIFYEYMQKYVSETGQKYQLTCTERQ